MPRTRIICLATSVLLGASACGGVTIEVQPTTVPSTSAASSTPPSSTSIPAGTVVTGDNSGVITSGDGTVVTGSGEQLVGSGVLITEARAVSGFHAIELRAFGDVEVTVGGIESLEVEADDNLLPLVTSEVVDGTLVIGVVPGHSFVNVTLRVRVGASTLDQAIVVGSANLRVDGLVSAAFDMRIEGSGDATLTGQTQDLTVEVEGSGSVEAFGLEAVRVVVAVAGSGDVEVSARDALTTTIEGSGDVSYRGAPALTTSIEGSGEVAPA